MGTVIARNKAKGSEELIQASKEAVENTNHLTQTTKSGSKKKKQKHGSSSQNNSTPARPEPPVAKLEPDIVIRPRDNGDYTRPLGIDGEEQSFVIGREDNHGFSFANNRISRTHAKITRRGERFFIQDLGSTNGTYVQFNGIWEKLTPHQAVEIVPPTRISIGGERFSFEYSSNQVNLSNPGLKQARQFQQNHLVDFDESLHYGYRDAGRGSEFDPRTGKTIPSREVIVVGDKFSDPYLAAAIQDVQQYFKTHQNLSELEKITYIHDYVDRVFSKNPPENVDEIIAPLLSTDNEILLGEIMKAGAGVCRHRAILTKILADKTGLKAQLVRGDFYSHGSGGGHAWNIFLLENGEKQLVDVMHRKNVPLTDPYGRYYFKVRGGGQWYP